MQNILGFRIFECNVTQLDLFITVLILPLWMFLPFLLIDRNGTLG